MPTGSPAAVAGAATTTTMSATTNASTSPSLTADNRGVTAPSSGTGGGSSHQHRLSQTNLYIRGLSPDTTDKDLVNLCQPSVDLCYLIFVLVLVLAGCRFSIAVTRSG